MTKDESQREDAKEHFDRVDDIERQIDGLLYRRFFLIRVRLGQSYTVETNDNDDETFEVLA